jgi:hypothetical protein
MRSNELLLHCNTEPQHYYGRNSSFTNQGVCWPNAIHNSLTTGPQEHPSSAYTVQQNKETAGTRSCTEEVTLSKAVL